MEEFQRTRALLFWERFYWSVEFSSEWALSEEFDYHILRDAGRPRERQFLTYNSSSYTIRERRSKTTSVRNSVIYSLKSEKRPLPIKGGHPTFRTEFSPKNKLQSWAVCLPLFADYRWKMTPEKILQKITKNGILLKPKRVTGIVEHLPPFRTKLVK